MLALPVHGEPVYSIADILRPQFGRTWQEAVAIVQELASVAGDLSVLPLPEDLSLTDAGTMMVGFAGETGEPPVVALARLLHDLLDGTEAPEALRGLAAESAGPSPAHASVQSFSRALSFFERPGRHNELIALASRIRLGRFADVEPERELERLREKVNAGAAKPAERREQPGVPFLVRHRGLFRAAAFGLVMVVLGVALVWGGPMLLEQLRGKPVVIDVSQTEVEPLPGSGDASADASGPISREGKSPVATSGAAPSRATPRAGDLTVVRSAPMDPLALPSPVRALASLSEGSVAPAARASGEWTIGPEDGVYSLADQRVQPPVLVRRQLPSGASPDAETGYFDLVVDQFGLVEQVRLISPTGSFRERILVSAAKAWQFRPARLDGRPVRFRVQIPITIAEEGR